MKTRPCEDVSACNHDDKWYLLIPIDQQNGVMKSGEFLVVWCKDIQCCQGFEKETRYIRPCIEIYDIDFLH